MCTGCPDARLLAIGHHGAEVATRIGEEVRTESRRSVLRRAGRRAVVSGVDMGVRGCGGVAVVVMEGGRSGVLGGVGSQGDGAGVWEAGPRGSREEDVGREEEAGRGGRGWRSGRGLASVLGLSQPARGLPRRSILVCSRVAQARAAWEMAVRVASGPRESWVRRSWMRQASR